MPALIVTEEKLLLIQQSLDFYFRIGIGQFERIKEHPTFEQHLYNEFKDKEGNTDYGKFHQVRDEVDEIFTQAKRLLYNEKSAVKNGGWGINHSNVDDSCRQAFDIVQVIRHEFRTRNPNRSDMTVDSHIHLTDRKTKILRLNFNPQEQMTQIELNEVLRLHKMWLNEEDGGQRANLCYADLRRADLSWANLRKADLSGADLRGVDLRGTNLRGADLRGADFRMADLSGAHLREADLKEADLRRADLSGADLRETDLKDADLNNSNITGEYFSDLNLYDCRKVPIHCRWSYGITNGMIHIGCVKKSIRDWDEFFASDEVLETPRGTQEFKQIEAVYLACKAYLQHINTE